MEQNKKTRNPGRGRGRQLGAAPQATNPDSHHQMERRDNASFKKEKEEGHGDRQKLISTINRLNDRLNRARMLLERKEKEFREELLLDREDIEGLQFRLSTVQDKLILQKEQNVILQNQAVQDREQMAASLESERRKVSEGEALLLHFRLESQKYILLKKELEMKVHQVEEQLLNKDQELLILKEEVDSLSGTTAQQTEELAEKQQQWETKFSVLEEELKKKEEEKEELRRKQEEDDALLHHLRQLTEQLQTKVEESQQSEKDWKEKYNALLEKSTIQSAESEDKALKKERKKKEKEEKKRRAKEEKQLKKQEKEAKKELKKKEKQAEAEKKQKEKEEKKKTEEKESQGFWCWRKKKV